MNTEQTQAQDEKQLKRLPYSIIKTDHIAIRTSSYYERDQADKNIKIHAPDYIVSNIKADDKLLIIDDVFDSGRSIQATLEHLKKSLNKNYQTKLKPPVHGINPVKMSPT